MMILNQSMKLLKVPIFTLIYSLTLWGAVYTKCAFGQSWQALPYLPPNEQTRFIAVHPEKSALSFLATRGNLYASSNHGKDWKQILKLGTDTEIYDLQFDENRIFLLTSEGLFESKSEGKKWKKIFGGIQGEHSVRSLTYDPARKHILYLGTERGLFVSHDNGRQWEKTHGFERRLIHQLKTDSQNNELFVATDKGLYRILPAQNRLDRVYVLRTASGEEHENLETDPDENSSEPAAKIKTILITPSSSLAMATEHGILISEDEGNYWEHLPDSGLPKTPIIDLVYSASQNTFFAATEKSVYFYLAKEKRWKELSFGLSTQRIKRLTLVSSGASEILYAVTENSVYKITVDSSLFYPDQIHLFSADRWNLLSQFFYYEPSISAVQKQAIHYANVSKTKTKRWQWTSRLKALVPSLSVGKDFSTTDTVDIDRGSTNEPDRYIVGPPDKKRGFNFDLNWQLSDLIWNSAQTSIDSREKLMIELRDDILSEVTRLYYERRRAQIEFVLRPPQDSLEQANAILRIDELTAYLDALTDGLMTKQLNSIYSKYPHFQTLWVLDPSLYESEIA